MASKIRTAIVMEISAGRNMSGGVNKPAIESAKPPKICHSRRGSSFTFPPKDSLEFFGNPSPLT